MTSDRAARIAAVKQAFVEGVKVHFPNLERVELADDAVIDLFTLGILDGPEDSFNEFLASLRHPDPPQEVSDEDAE